MTAAFWRIGYTESRDGGIEYGLFGKNRVPSKVGGGGIWWIAGLPSVGQGEEGRMERIEGGCGRRRQNSARS